MANVLKTGTIVLAALAGLAIGAASNGWRASGLGFGVLPAAEKAKEIIFENGSVRTPSVFVRASPAGIPIGGMRKCSHPSETLYTERECPIGYKEARVRGAHRVTVLARPGSEQEAPARRKSLYDVLDLRPEPTLRERMIERATEDLASR